jgi:hypothetical protein
MYIATPRSVLMVMMAVSKHARKVYKVVKYFKLREHDSGLQWFTVFTNKYREITGKRLKRRGKMISWYPLAIHFNRVNC